MQRLLALAAAALLMTPSVAVHAETSAAKKELVQKVLQLQQPGVENVARQLAEQPAAQMLQQAGMALNGLPEDKRESTGKAIQTEARKYADETVPLVRDRAVKLAPTTMGPMLEEKFSEDELKQVVAWLESPVNKKLAQAYPAMNDALVKKLVEDSKPQVEPKVQALERSIRKLLDAAGGAAAGGKPAKK